MMSAKNYENNVICAACLKVSWCDCCNSCSSCLSFHLFVSLVDVRESSFLETLLRHTSDVTYFILCRTTDWIPDWHISNEDHHLSEFTGLQVTAATPECYSSEILRNRVRLMSYQAGCSEQGWRVQLPLMPTGLMEAVWQRLTEKKSQGYTGTLKA